MPSITETTLRFTGGYPPLPVLAAAFGLAALMWWLYGRESRFGGGALAKLPALLRSMAVFVLVMALAGPVLRHVTTLRQLGRVVIAVDGSASMQLTDEAAEKSATTTKSRVRRIITIDDLITALPKKNSFYKSGFKDARPRLRRTLGMADRLVVSTGPLADICADMVGDIRIMPNCLEGALWGDVTPPRLPHKKPRVGWAGAQQHLGDLELIYSVVETLADEVDWIFMGMCPDPLRPFVKESHGFVQDFRLYPQALARLDLDLAIAPLEIHAFNECKSNLRLLEYGAMGWPVICTDIYPYQNAPVTRLPNDPQRWIATIREQLAEPEALRAAGLDLQRWVADGFILENHATSWFAAYGP